MKKRRQENTTDGLAEAYDKMFCKYCTALSQGARVNMGGEEAARARDIIDGLSSKYGTKRGRKS